MPAPLDLPIWIDRARVRRRVPGARVEGETQTLTVLGAWFDCRLPPRESSERLEGGHRVLEDRRELTARLSDSTGAMVELSERDQIEVELGPAPYRPAGIWEVVRVMVPRNRDGDELLLVATIERREEH
jgi:hypothetical protein